MQRQGLGERGLAGIRVGDNGKRPAAGGLLVDLVHSGGALHFLGHGATFTADPRGDPGWGMWRRNLPAKGSSLSQGRKPHGRRAKNAPPPTAVGRTPEAPSAGLRRATLRLARAVAGVIYL